MRLALALVIVASWCASASPPAVGTPASNAEARPDTPSVPTEEHEAEARLLLAAANIVGGLWHAVDSPDDRRALELVIWGLRIGTRGVALAPEMPLSHLDDVDASVRERTKEAAANIRAGNPEAAADALGSMLDRVDRLNDQELARIRTLTTLAYVAKEEPQLAVDAMDGAVSVACSVICSPDSPYVVGANDPRTRDVGRHKIQFATYQVLLAARTQLKMGRVDRVVGALGKMIDTQRASPTTFRALSPAGGLKQSRRFRTTRLEAPDLVALHLMLARAHMSRGDVEAAIESYEAILAIEGAVWQLDITLENLANLHFDHGNFERSLTYQRAWLRDSDWIGRACPEVCAVPEPERT
ncbi:MAG: hypothetical protein OXU77_03765 [Gammaproteobacteria bacterium]|nr:hypothetical protein [Gammaproteobacteria bacterium]MDE0442556.1 hypothetical protein [Gammaproteobacteria bacterium]